MYVICFMLQHFQEPPHIFFHVGRTWKTDFFKYLCRCQCQLTPSRQMKRGGFSLSITFSTNLTQSAAAFFPRGTLVDFEIRKK